MKLEHGFTVPVPVEQAWDVLLDLPQVAPCMPGATLTSYEGDEFAGTVKVKLGPINLTYQGTGQITERNVEERRAVIEASGKDRRGGGTAKATVTAQLRPDGEGSTKVDVVTDLAITGRPAQFGRGMMVDVGNKLIGQFADCLSGKLTAGGAAAATAAGQPAATGAGTAGTPDTTPASTGSAAGRASGATTAPSAPTPSTNTAAPPSAPTPSPAAAQPQGAPATGSGTVPKEPATASTGTQTSPMEHEVEPIDLLEVTGAGDIATRVAKYALAFAAGLLVGWLIFRGTRG